MKMPNLLPYKAQALFLALPLILLGCKEQNNSFKVKPRPATAASPSQQNKVSPQNKTTVSEAQLCAQELCQDVKQPSLETILEKAGHDPEDILTVSVAAILYNFVFILSTS